MLAEQLVELIGPGKFFFCNSGGEATEGLFKLARKFGHDEGRYEILDGRKFLSWPHLGGHLRHRPGQSQKGVRANGAGFRHIPYNDLAAARAALSPATAAILIEGMQGEGGVTPATPEYLLGLRQLCDEKQLLLLMDGVQCGHFRTGRFQSFQRILEDSTARRRKVFARWRLDGQVPGGRVSHRRVLGARALRGFAGRRYAWQHLRRRAAGVRGGLESLEVIERDVWRQRPRGGRFSVGELSRLAARYPSVMRQARGLGLMIGWNWRRKIPAFAASEKAPAIQFDNALHQAGLLAVPAGTGSSACCPLKLVARRSLGSIGLIESVAIKLSP